VKFPGPHKLLWRRQGIISNDGLRHDDFDRHEVS
jgi:hypothetical protein